MSDSTTSPAAVEADARNGQSDPLVEKEATGLMNAIAPGDLAASGSSRLRVYADATVALGCFEKEFLTPSRQLFDAFTWGDFVLLLSDSVAMAVEDESPEAHAVLSRVPDAHSEFLTTSRSSEDLVAAYVRVGAVPDAARHHARHFAFATLAKADVLVSWDFENVVNLHRIRFCNYVNVARGHERLDVQAPQALGLPVTATSREPQSFSNVKLLREVRDTIGREVQDMTADEYRQWRDSRVHTDPNLRKLARRMAMPTSQSPKAQRSGELEGGPRQ